MPRWTRSSPPPFAFHWVEVEDVTLTRADDWTDFPPISPYRVAALLRRWRGFNLQYAAMLPRWPALRSWEAVVLPDRFTPASVRQAYVDAWGQGYTEPNDFPRVFMIDGSNSRYLSISEIRAAVGASEPETNWATDDRAVRYNGGFGEKASLYGGWEHVEVMAAANEGNLVLRTGREANALNSETTGPTYYPITVQTRNDDRIFLESRLRLAGAALWRMWYISMRLTEDDWLCLNEGGRGGARTLPIIN
jgi:hypothetical protein